MLQQVQLYNDQLEFDENNTKGPFGDYADIKQPYKNTGQPQYNFFGTKVYSPFGIAAGPLPRTRFIKAALDKGFDIVTLKSVRTDTFPINPYPHVRPVTTDGNVGPDTEKVLVADKYSEPLAAANSLGIPSVSPAKWQPFVKESIALPKKGQAVLVAFQGTARGKGREDFVQDHVRGIELIKQTGYESVIEINLSCPNEGEAVMACFDLDITERIVNAVREAYPQLKFIIKTAYYSDHNQMKDLIKRVGNIVDGFSMINTIPVPVVDKSGNNVFPGRPKVGISGAPIKWAGLEMTRYLKQYREEFGYEFNIMGVGGVLSSDDFHEYRQAGADIVMSVTGAMWNPNLAAEIKQSLL
ncbi:dihydroorotate oxidase [Candidatus Parcubacteria bacterium]|nr:dihydroorotate oxidase [Candidatus Parcubacteria bacterium]